MSLPLRMWLIGETGRKKKKLLIRPLVIPRERWEANPPKGTTALRHPVNYVIISHTASEPGHSIAECCTHIRIFQKFHQESRNWDDIAYNFLVGGDGNVYEGRGWDNMGAHAKGMNDVSIGISFIGTFVDVLPPPSQIRACKMLIDEGISLGNISANYKLLGHRQVSPTESPGEMLYKELQKWNHWSPEI
ncbi:hypothetical protein J437_LFUL012355 [Ladona fulva]|uniref:Peptidoglycan-recognition protein n=1 Tax=Ladona fulva TaxID=123851 RepID=A0A8K0K0Q3_LADFU|nr:hypothetical protein J437_LFUL012355 [Ladona fulva]